MGRVFEFVLLQAHVFPPPPQLRLPVNVRPPWTLYHLPLLHRGALHAPFSYGLFLYRTTRPYFFFAQSFSHILFLIKVTSYLHHFSPLLQLVAFNMDASSYLFPAVLSPGHLPFSSFGNPSSESLFCNSWTVYLNGLDLMSFSPPSLVACTQLYRSLCWSVGPLVSPKSLRLKSPCFFLRLELNGDKIWVTAPAQLLYCPCPPARDWCCRVYGLVN